MLSWRGHLAFGGPVGLPRATAHLMFSPMPRQPNPEPFDLWMTPSACVVCFEREAPVAGSEAWLEEAASRILYRRGLELLAFESLPPWAVELARAGHAAIVEFGTDGPIHEQPVLPSRQPDGKGL